MGIYERFCILSLLLYERIMRMVRAIGLIFKNPLLG